MFGLLTALFVLLGSLFAQTTGAWVASPSAWAASPSATLSDSTASDSTATGSAPSAHNPVLFIGVSGVRPEDVYRGSLQLNEQLKGYSIAALSTRTVSPRTCPTEGWMSLRTTADVQDRYYGAFPYLYDDDVCTRVSIDFLGGSLASTESTQTEPQRAQISNFARHISETTWPAAQVFSEDALAIGPNAALPLADSAGVVQNYLPYPALVDNEQQRAKLREILDAAPGDVLVDVGTVRGTDELNVVLSGMGRALTRIANVMAANEASEAPRRVVIASLGDQWTRPHLHFVATNSFDVAEGHTDLLASNTTRSTGFLAIADLRALVTGNFANIENVPVERPSQAYAAVVGIEQQSYVARNATATWYRVFNGVVIIGLVAFIALFLLRPGARKESTPGAATHAEAGTAADANLALAETRWRSHVRTWRAVELLNTFAFAFVPAALILNFLPWWKLVDVNDTGNPLGLAATILIALLLTAIAQFTRLPAASLAVLAFAVLSLDVILGSAHQRNGFMGSLILTSRRYYGISNRTYLILIICGAMGLLVLLTWKRLRREQQLWLIGGAGLITLLVDAVPAWGADFGGPPGIVGAFGLFLVLFAGWRLRWWFVFVWIGLSASMMALAGVLDSRSTSESHIGNFWSTLGTTENVQLVAGKLRDVTKSIVGRPDLLILIAAAIVIAVGTYFAARKLDSVSGLHFSTAREAASLPGFKPAIVAVLAGILIAVPINDSGALMVKEGGYIAIPLILALGTRQLVTRRQARH